MSVQKLASLDKSIQNLIVEATKVRASAYCPYSNFQVGSAVLCEDGAVYTGCNVENVSYSLTICAERSAYTKAVSSGNSKFIAVAVVAYQENYFTTPCGACRQFISEFGNVNIYVSKPGEEDVLVLSLDKALPYRFENIKDTHCMLE
ncbi:cytidine deaminase-like [Euwallacea similis]|uniref:cytidine deaminase-like n=1 Tax=Euwallacea similis TaxID=1736056 RepID=UPI00344DEBCC